MTTIYENGIVEFRGYRMEIHGDREHQLEGGPDDFLQDIYGPQPWGRLIYFHFGEEDEDLPLGLAPVPLVIMDAIMTTEGPFPVVCAMESEAGLVVACFGDPQIDNPLPPIASGSMAMLGFDGCAQELSLAYGTDSNEKDNLTTLTGPINAFVRSAPEVIKQELELLPFFEVGAMSLPYGFFMSFCYEPQLWPLLPLDVLSALLQNYGYEPDDKKIKYPLFQKEIKEGFSVLRTEKIGDLHKIVQKSNITKASKLLL